MRRKLSCKCLALAFMAATWGTAAQAETFKLQCEVEGKLQDSSDKVAPARVVVEVQVIGRHFYFNVSGPPYYAMRVSTLVTDDFKGENLFSSSQLGARRQQRSNQHETEILIDRASMELTAHNDVSRAGKTLRFSYAGKCRPL